MSFDWPPESLSPETDEVLKDVSEPTEQASLDIQELRNELNQKLNENPQNEEVAVQTFHLRWEIAALSKSQETENLKQISYNDFMQFDDLERFQYITATGTDISKIYSGDQSSFTVDYRYWGVENEEIYMKTTAWLNFPTFIRKVVSEGIEYQRRNDWLQAEFFSEEGDRLTIHTGTEIDILETLSLQEVKSKKEALTFQNTADILSSGMTPELMKAEYAKLVWFSEKDLENVNIDLDSIWDINPEVAFEEAFVEAARVIDRENMYSKLSEDSFAHKIRADETRWELIGKYSKEASFKNNNPTGISWFGKDGLKASTRALFSSAWVKYSIWTKRPSNEWAHYVAFASVEDGMLAYKAMLTSEPDLTIREKLFKWVSGFTELHETWGENQIEYADWIINKAGVNENMTIWEISQSENEKLLRKLMHAQIQKESWNYYREIIVPWAYIETL